MPPKDDAERFHRVLWPHRAAVLRTARFLCRDVHEADDLTQEVFLKAYQALERLTDDRGASSWLLAILRNARIDRLRSRGAHPTVSLEGADIDPAAQESSGLDSTDSSLEMVLEALSDQKIIDALHELPEEIRWTVLLVDVHGMSHMEAAEIQEVPVGTIKSRAHRGREMLRKLLVGRDQVRITI